MVKRTATRATRRDQSPPSPPLPVSAALNTCVIAVRVTPRASRDAISLESGQLRVWLRAAPVEGAANTALINLLAARLNLPRRAITIVQGASARLKRITIEGLTEEEARQRLAATAGA